MGRRNVPRWLFVCTGNICRSPMAEGMFRAALGTAALNDDWTIDSAGLHALVGRAPEPEAIAVAASYGADIERSRARTFEPGDFARFDHIVALDRGHLDLLEFIRPDDFKGTLQLLPSRDGGSIEVPDPYGQDAKSYAEAGRLIAEGIAALLGDRLPD